MDWDQRYRENDTPWERGAPAPPLRDYLKSRRLEGRALVPGCGLGHDARLLAEQGCDTLAIDLSPLALQRAQALPPPTRGSLSFRRLDFLDPDNGLPDASFDLIFEHTCFCAIEPDRRPDYVRAAARLIKPGGELLGIFFAHLDDPGDPPFATSPEEIEQRFGSDFLVNDLGRPRSCFPGRENEERLYRLVRR